MNLAHPSRTAKTVSQCVINDLWVKMKSVKCNFSNAAALFTSLLYKYYILTSQTFFHKKKKKKICTLTGQLVMLKVIDCLKICTCQIHCLYCVEEMKINSLILAQLI